MYNYCLKYSFTLKNKKSKHRLLLSFLLLFFSATRLYSLDTFQLEEVEWPLEYLTPISGTFTEYRNSSVHLGLDFKTYGINGLKLLSATKGYVESISYSPSGYGLSIITYSPNTRLKTRYAHLNDFKGSISGFELLRQSLLLLNEEKFSVRLNANEFQFKKKDWIARTGETGVGIAHLHLEIFDSKGFYNPMIFKNYSQIDKQYPIVNLVSIETDNGEMHYLKATQKKDNLFEIEETETPITVSGKVKVKVTAYDLISSINRNGIFGFTLKANEKELYTKNLDFLSYKELSEKHALYDINRSSLSPPNYVYNLFDGREEKNYSFNTNDFPLNEKILLNISVFDSNKNTSTIEFSVIVKESSPIQNKKVDTKIFLSDDSNVIINLKKNKIIGKGEIKIQKLNSLPESLQTDGLLPEGQSYEITAYDYSWLGKAEATLKIGNLSQGQSLYLYDKETKILNLLKTKSSKNGLS
ncbi:MAG: hypothetical protein HUU45_11490, partial [Leptospiraceae bacterium]|nr:hypothetical protein [Leptospiraceae bacterium]